MSKRVQVRMPDSGRKEAAVQAFVDGGRDETPAPARTPRANVEGQTVRLNLNMPQELHRHFKTACASQGVTISEVVTQLVQEWADTHR